MKEVLLVIFVTFFIGTGYGDRVKQKIYIDLETQSACFRILNSTHEVGCASAYKKGNVGTIHYVQEENDYDWILSKGPLNPYVVVLNAENFTESVVRKLTQSDRVNGILVINLRNVSILPIPTSPFPEEGFSTQDKCPNDLYGMYSDSAKYKECQKGDWNPSGTSLGRLNLNVPVFTLDTEKDVNDTLYKCFFPFNAGGKDNKSTSYPACAAEMKSGMNAAVNSVVCRRRTNRFAVSFSMTTGFCDPLGDNNVAATLMEMNDTVPRANDSVIVVAAKLDAASLFMNNYVAADTTVAGIVTLLASAEALWKVKDTIRQVPNAKDIMYTFFHGETFDYIGSSRAVYDMRKATFPPAPSSHADSQQYLAQVKLQHIAQIVEMNQVGRRDDGGSLWAHTDPLGQTEVSQMVADLKKFGQAVNVTIAEADKDLPLPPASAQSFLKHRLDIPTVVITDHQKAYTNKYYNSRFDVSSFINADDYPANSSASEQYDFVTKQAELIGELSTTLARYLYKASTGQDPSDEEKKQLTANNSMVTHLLYCFLKSPNCELFLESVDEDNVNSLTTAKAPFSFYVSVSDLHTNEVTQMVYALLARFTGDKEDLSKGKCSRTDDKRFSYLWVQGAKKPGSKTQREGWCLRSTTFYTKAESPAFDLDGYDVASNEFPMWSESNWGANAISVRLFLIPSPQLEVSMLLVGIAVLAVSLLVVYFLYVRSDILFTQLSPPSGDPATYNPML